MHTVSNIKILAPHIREMNRSLTRHWTTRWMFSIRCAHTDSHVRIRSQAPSSQISGQRQLHERCLKASFWRGGTSKGLILRDLDLPTSLRQALQPGGPFTASYQQQFQDLFASIMGSPDPYGRQLNGMGGGVSSLSKVMVVRSSTSPDVDIDYMFQQIGVKDGRVDVAGNCGNLSAAVGPFALNAHLFEVRRDHVDAQTGASLELDGLKTVHYPITIRMKNLNTNKIVHATFRARLHEAGFWTYQPLGNCSIDGVPGTGSQITLSFVDPAGSKTAKALPTGNAVDLVEIGDQTIRASLVDVSNPGVFIDGRDVGWSVDGTPDQLNADHELLQRLEAIRRKGTEMMGLDPTVSSIPKIVLLFPSTDDKVDIACQALSMEQAHKASPVTLALNLGVSCKMEGTIPFQLSKHLHASNTVIGHPSGTLEVGADIEGDRIVSAKLVRTARCLMDGFVNSSVPGPVMEQALPMDAVLSTIEKIAP